jgi:hypothetical protein
MRHGCLVEVFAKLLGSSLKLRVVDSIEAFFDADDLFHNVDALHNFTLDKLMRTFFWSTSHLEVSWVIFYRSKMSILAVIKLYM